MHERAYLTINHESFSRKELFTLSSDKIKSINTPHWEKEIYRFIYNWLDKTPVILQYSSGTTGKSKEIVLKKESMIGSAENTCRYFDLRNGQTALLCLPAEYIAGKMMVVRSIVGGLNLKLVEPVSNPGLGELNRIDFCAMVPLQVLHTFSSGKAIPAIDKLIIGGAEISPDIEKSVMDMPVEVYATYGMAETCSHIAVRRINGPSPEPYYHILPGIVIETDDRGCLVIRADYLPAPVITNDLVRLIDSERFIWSGRNDNLINSGGIKIVPEEMEAQISEKTGFTCALVGFADEKLGQRLIFLAEKNKMQTDNSLILSELQKIIPAKLQPKKIIWVEKLPRNKYFKVDRLKLMEMVRQML